MAKKPLGIILYRGPSMLDGMPIMVIAPLENSTNDKTGDMIPTYIIKTTISPIMSMTDKARKSNYYSDYSVCGDCKQRDFGSCYVNYGQAPEQVFGAFHRDGYVSYTPDMLKYFENKDIRLGSYGEPAAVPIEVWDTICGVASGYTGYTHQWNNPDIDSNLKKYCMASCDTTKEYFKAKEQGWRTFRVRLPLTSTLNKFGWFPKFVLLEQLTLDNEKICPASKEAGMSSNCAKCKACMGLSADTNKDVCITIHGTDVKIKKFIDGIKCIINKKGWRKEFSIKDRKRVPVVKVAKKRKKRKKRKITLKIIKKREVA